MKTTIIVTSVAAALVPPATQAQLVVAAPGVEARQDHKNIFDALKYAWEQTQWADKLATLHSTLTTVQQHLETANLVKQAIGDPVAAIALIDNGLFSEYLQDSGIGETLGELIDITREGVELSVTVQQLFSPIDMAGWKNFSGDMTATFDGMASFRDSSDPLKRFRAVENAYSRFEILIGRRRTNGEFSTSRSRGSTRNLEEPRMTRKCRSSWVRWKRRRPLSTTSTTFRNRRRARWKCSTRSMRTAAKRRRLPPRKSAGSAIVNSLSLPQRRTPRSSFPT
jgi:hypothetical protein